MIFWTLSNVWGHNPQCLMNGPSQASKGKKGTSTYTEELLRKYKSVVHSQFLISPCPMRPRQIHSLKRCGSSRGTNKCWAYKKAQNKNTTQWYRNTHRPCRIARIFKRRRAQLFRQKMSTFENSIRLPVTVLTANKYVFQITPRNYGKKQSDW